jgi:hypothetical protein
MKKLLFIVSTTVAAVALWTSPAHAFIAWSNTTGSATGFSWLNGGSTFGLYGNPTLVGGNTLLFFPNAFRAESFNGVSNTITDTIFVDILAAPGQELSGIQISEFGDWAINAAGSLNISGNITVTDLNDPFRNPSDALVANPGNLITSPGSGSWDGTMMIDLSALGGNSWTWIHLELTNTLTANSSVGTSSFVQKKVAGTGIQMTLIPTPGAGMLLGLGGLLAVRRRR